MGPTRLRARVGSLFLVVPALCLAGCTSTDAAAPHQGPSTDPVTATASSTPGLKATLTEPGAESSSIPWTLRGMSMGGRRLEITFIVGDPGCHRVRGVRVVQTTTTVELAVLTDRIGRSKACALDAAGHDEYVVLASPLGKRELLHAPVVAST